MNLKSKAELMVCFVSLSNILLINPLSLYPSIGSAHEAFLCNPSLSTKMKESFFVTHLSVLYQNENDEKLHTLND